MRTSFESFLEDNGKSKSDYTRILVIPNAGCTGCISRAESFFLEQYNDQKILFIFTLISDIKLFESGRIGPYISNDNVIVDQRGQLPKLGFHSQYPCVLKGEDNEYIALVPF
ncbi:hypothetical protein [Parapedobacter koreensis]|uniref:hypothetical protein n=1 Tax=Parapedobacter koreensis TaxID=332977 RepID=UPI0015A55EC9|nr:hypothetical protein [Parapedobacter koreensis]